MVLLLHLAEIALLVTVIALQIAFRRKTMKAANLKPATTDGGKTYAYGTNSDTSHVEPHGGNRKPVLAYAAGDVGNRRMGADTED